MDGCMKSLHTKQDGLRTKLCAFQDSLGVMKGRLHDEKSKRRKVMFDEELKCKRLENEIQQELNSLEETNNDLRDELKEALSKKSCATRLTAKAKKLASHRLKKWHIESERRCSAEDEVAHLNKSAMHMNNIIKEYRMVIEQSQKSKRRLKKEWANDEAAAAHGGGRQWPTWVVQIICELLVNGTKPAAVPTAMQTMYKMLTGDTPDELLCVSFVRSCRVVVEVIGEDDCCHQTCGCTYMEPDVD